MIILYDNNYFFPIPGSQAPVQSHFPMSEQEQVAQPIFFSSPELHSFSSFELYFPFPKYTSVS